MKTILEINNDNYGSTGNIMLNIASEAKKNGFEVYTACKSSRQARKFKNSNHLYIGTWIDRILSERLAYLTGLKDHFNIVNTFIFLNAIKKIKPDLIHLHNIHDTFINIDMFFKYVKKSNIPIIWTFHDCYPFTGQCTYFELQNCNRWKTGCGKCSQIHKYPDTIIDKTRKQYSFKKKCFSGLKNMIIVSPSKWLNDLIEQSFLTNYERRVINNGIDLDVFKPTKSSFKKKYNIEDKDIVLGVATNWEGKRKGLDVFINLANRLPDKFKIVLVGTNKQIDKLLPSNILSINKTYDVNELVEIYSSASVFVNPTREDNFPTVNLEALACGTPVITFDTGGSPESINSDCGIVVEKNNINELEKAILTISNHNITSKACIQQAHKFSKSEKFKEYIDLYKTMLNN